MIVLYTDFGFEGPYVGQLKSVLLERLGPRTPIIDLMHDAPVYSVQAAAHLLASVVLSFPSGAIIMGVVDPGVGSSRRAVVLDIAGRTYVGPENGLFDVLAARSGLDAGYVIQWRPRALSASFHGRDVFAPVTARLIADGPEALVAEGVLEEDASAGHVADVDGAKGDLAEVIYQDRFGNLMTGLRARSLDQDKGLSLGGQSVTHHRTFSDAAAGQAFWYANSQGLVEIAVNQGSAASVFGVGPGAVVTVA